MNPLCSKEARVFAEALERIHSVVDLAQFSHQVFHVLEDLIPDVVITMDEFNTKTGVARDAINRPPIAHADWRHRLHEVVPIEHPVYHAIQKGARHCMAISDFLSDRQLRSTGLYAEVLTPIDSRFQIALPLLIPNHVAGVTLNRAVNFSEAELTIARLIGPHLALAHVHAQHFTALRDLQGRQVPDAEQLRALGLTPRETEVLIWVIQGKRDGEIAQIVDCSVRTVQKHVQGILAKLRVETRTAAAIEAVRLSTAHTAPPT